jgi:carboxyl-terminal processing protease
MKRMEESKGIYEEIMNVPFDYSIDESFNTDYDKAPYAKKYS